MNPKYYRAQIKKDKTSICPWCAKTNHHVTGECCAHVYKVTVKGIVYYYWGFRPTKED